MYNLREFVLTHVILDLARVEGRVRAALAELTSWDSAGSARSGGEF